MPMSLGSYHSATSGRRPATRQAARDLPPITTERPRPPVAVRKTSATPSTRRLRHRHALERGAVAAGQGQDLGGVVGLGLPLLVLRPPPPPVGDHAVHRRHRAGGHGGVTGGGEGAAVGVLDPRQHRAVADQAAQAVTVEILARLEAPRRPLIDDDQHHQAQRRWRWRRRCRRDRVPGTTCGEHGGGEDGRGGARQHGRNDIPLDSRAAPGIACGRWADFEAA